jgi:hypothetical protein
MMRICALMEAASPPCKILGTCFSPPTVLLWLIAYRGTTLPIFHPEFGRFMLEATPGKPWGIGFKDLLDVEQNMRLRFDY